MSTVTLVCLVVAFVGSGYLALTAPRGATSAARERFIGVLIFLIAFALIWARVFAFLTTGNL